ncbi:MAG TPA: hypothetical protein VM056_01040 [Terriglobales bacterium]|nr:hypothetical protein [Terriglobales bacterium]
MRDAYKVGIFFVIALVALVYFAVTKFASKISGPTTGSQARAGRPLTAPPELTSEIESLSQTSDDFQDLIFYIDEHKRLTDGSQAMLVSAFYEGRRVGFRLVLSREWRTGAIKDFPEMRMGTVRYESVGEMSDRLIQILDKLYASRLGSQRMADRIEFTGISLAGNPLDWESGEAKIKLFYESEPEEEKYAEIYTNIDLASRRLRFDEKDTDYRRPLMNALTRR